MTSLPDLLLHRLAATVPPAVGIVFPEARLLAVRRDNASEPLLAGPSVYAFATWFSLTTAAAVHMHERPQGNNEAEIAGCGCRLRVMCWLAAMMELGELPIAASTPVRNFDHWDTCQVATPQGAMSVPHAVVLYVLDQLQGAVVLLLTTLV